MNQNPFRKLGVVILISIFVFALTFIPTTLNAYLGEEEVPFSPNEVYEQDEGVFVRGEDVISERQPADKKPQYAPGEVLFKVKEGVDPQSVLQEVGIEAKSLGRIHSRKPAIAKFKKDYKLEKDSDGWYWFKGKQYKEAARISDEQAFKKVYAKMSPVEKSLYRSYKIELAKGVSVEQSVSKLAKNPNVEYAQPNYLMQTNIVPTDPFYDSSGGWGQEYDDLWGLKSGLLNCEPAWEISEGEGIVVAVIDTGVDYNHEDFFNDSNHNGVLDPGEQYNIWVNPGEDINHNGIVDMSDFNGIDDDGNGKIDDIRGYDFSDEDSDPLDDIGHGTHCAGTIAAVGNNDVGMIGVAPKAKIMPVKIFPNAYTDVCVRAIKYAADNGAKVLSNSWGPTGRSPSNPELENAIDYVYEINEDEIPNNGIDDDGDGFIDNVRGCVVVFAAGNSNDNVDYYHGANYSKTIAVAATAHNNEKVDFSNYGPKIDVSAPGGETGFYRPDGSVDVSKASILSLRADGTDMFDSAAMREKGYVPGDAFYPQPGNPDSQYYRALGTSMACPHVAGVVALIRAARPQFSNEDIAKIVRSSVSHPQQSRYYIGGGVIDAEQVLSVTNPLSAEAKISSPTYNDSLRKEILPIRGIAEGTDYELSYSYSGFYGDDWTIIPKAETVVEDILAYLDDESMNEGKVYVKLESFDATGVKISHATTFSISSLLRSGWPVQVGGFVDYSVMVADIDNDGEKEIIVGASDKKLYAFRQDGSLLNGWPIDIGGMWGTVKSSPTLADLDGDGDLEIIISHDRRIHAWHHTGDPVDGWPVTMFLYDSVLDIDDMVLRPVSDPVVGDIDNDGDLEILAVSYGHLKDFGSGYSRKQGAVYAWHHDATLVDGWPVLFEWVSSSPALADLDFDGDLEIIVGFEENITVLHHDGTVMEGWENQRHGYMGSSPAIGDIDMDGDLEIIATMGLNRKIIYAFHHDGTFVEGNWPFDTGFHNSFLNFKIAPSPFLADVDNDGNLEIIAENLNGEIFVLNHDGTVLDGWPQQKNYLFDPRFGDWGAITGDIDGDQNPEIIATDYKDGVAFLRAWHYDGTPVPGLKESTSMAGTYATPFLDDIDNDGFSEIIVGGLDGRVYLWDLDHEYDPANTQWPMIGRNIQHSKRYAFYNAPDIINVTPTSVYVSDEITITGQHFGSTQGESFLSFSQGLRITTVVSWSDTEIICAIPEGTSSGNVFVVTEKGISNGAYITVIETVPPELTITAPQDSLAVSPIGFDFTGTAQDISGVDEVRVTIEDHGRSILTVDNEVANYSSDTEEWSFQVLSTYLTPGAELTLSVRAKDVQDNWSDEQFIIVAVALPPTITDISPSEAEQGNSVVVRGTNFRPTQGNGFIEFHDGVQVNDIPVSDWTDTEIHVSVPDGVETGQVYVVSDYGRSNGINFTILDTVAPTVTILVPDDGALLIDDFYFSGRAEDLSGIDEVRISVYDHGRQSYTIENRLLSIISTDRWTYRVQTTDVTVGALATLSVRAKDTYDNWSEWETVSVNIEGEEDILPVITGINPDVAQRGNIITITGDNFGPIQRAGYVSFFGQNQNQIQRWSEGEIVCTVPLQAVSGEVSVISENGRSDGFYLSIEETNPTIFGIVPSTGRSGDIVTLSGENFSFNIPPARVEFYNGQPVGQGSVAQMLSWNDWKIRCRVPPDVRTGPVYVIDRQNRVSNSFYFTAEGRITPHITEIFPSQVNPGEPISIRGADFRGPHPDAYVKFGEDINVPSFEVIGWGDRNIDVRVPDLATSGMVYVETDQGISQGVYLHIDDSVPFSITLHSPIENGWFRNNYLSVTGEVVSATPVPFVDISLDGTNAVQAPVTAAGIFSWQLTNLIQGNHEVTVTATNQSGDNTSITMPFLIDFPPQVTIDYPSDGGEVSSTGFVFRGTADDYGAIRRVSVYVYDLGSGTNTESQAANYNPETKQWDFQVLPDYITAGAQARLKIYAYDGIDLTSQEIVVNVISPEPVVTGIVPAIASIGTTVTITGEYFGSSLGYVEFHDGVRVTDIPDSDWSGTVIVCPVPDSAESGDVVVVTDAGRSNGFPITINNPPVLDSIGNKTVDENQLLTFTVSATDLDGDDLTYSASDLPQGANFDTTTQTFSWTPTFEQQGNYTVTFTVSDRWLEDSETITITVNDVPLPQITYLSPTRGTVNSYVYIPGSHFGTQTASSRIEFSGPGGTQDAYLYSWYDTDSYTYVFCKVPDLALGTYQVRVINDIGASDPLNYEIMVPAQINITSPVYNARVSNEGFTVEGTTVNGSSQEIAEVRVWLYDYGRSTYTVSNALANYNSSTNTWQFQVLPTHVTGEQRVYIRAQANDTNGAYLAYKYTIVNVVAPVPAITGLSLTSGAPGKFFTINGQNFGTTRAQVEFSNGGSPMYAHSYWWNDTAIGCSVPVVSPGMYNVTVINSGGRSNSYQFTVTAKPVVTITSPASSSVPYEELTFAGSVTSSLDITEVRVYVSNYSGWAVSNALANYDSNSKTWNFQVLPEHMIAGSWLRLWVNVKDSVGTWSGWQSKYVTVENSGQVSSPTVTINSPQANATVSSTGFQFTGTADAGTGISEVRVYVFDNSRGNYTVSNSLVTNYDSNSKAWSFNVQATHVTPGSLARLWVNAKDNAGSWSGWKYIYVNVEKLLP